MDNLFKIIYFVVLVMASIIRVIYTRPYKRKLVSSDKKTVTDAILISLPGIGMFVLPIIQLQFPHPMKLPNTTSSQTINTPSPNLLQLNTIP